MASIKINIFWNVLRVTSNLLFPLITFPYASRILGPESIGLFNFALAIASYFTLFASLGFPVYGTREIAVAKNDSKVFNDTVNAIFSANMLAALLVTIIYVIFCITVERDNLTLFLIVGISIMLSAISFEWFYQGIEDFKYLTVRGIIVKSISVICLFVFVKSSDDLIIYAVLTVIAICGNNVLNLLRLRKYVRLRFTRKGILKHSRGASILFLGTIAVSLYSYMNDILVGALDSMKGVAFFSTGNKVIHIVLSVISVISVSIVPKMSELIGLGKTDESAALQKQGLNLILYVAIPMCIGMAVLAKPIMLLFAGEKFLPAVEVLEILSLLIIVVPLSSFLGYQVLIPNRKEKYGNYAVISGAIVNIGFALILVPKISFLGVAVSLLLAEITITLVHLYYSERYMQLKWHDFIPVKSLISGLIMGAVIYFLKERYEGAAFTFIWIVAGAVIYILILILTKDSFTRDSLINKILKR